MNLFAMNCGSWSLNFILLLTFYWKTCSATIKKRRSRSLTCSAQKKKSQRGHLCCLGRKNKEQKTLKRTHGQRDRCAYAAPLHAAWSRSSTVRSSWMDTTKPPLKLRQQPLCTGPSLRGLFWSHPLTLQLRCGCQQPWQLLVSHYEVWEIR